MRLVILGIDPGSRRYGVAAADEETRFAHPLEIIDAAVADPVERIVTLARELNATVIVVGRPISLSGTAGPAVVRSDELVAALEGVVSAEVVQHDERFTSSIAESAQRAASPRSRKRAHVDAVAAQLMLQSYLDSSSPTALT